MCSFSETWHIHGFFTVFSQSSVSSLCFASEGHFWEQSLARGETPLHWAAGNGQVETVKLLLEAKASVTVKDDLGRGPRLGDVMGFRWLLLSYLILLYYYLLLYLLLCGGCFVC